LRHKNCGRILLGVTLLSFCGRAAWGKPPGPVSSGSEGGGTRFYSEGEVAEMVEEISLAAEEAIEKAAAEAAKAAALAAVEREGAALALAGEWRRECEQLKRETRKTNFFIGLGCFVGGVLAGAGGILITTGGR